MFAYCVCLVKFFNYSTITCIFLTSLTVTLTPQKSGPKKEVINDGQREQIDRAQSKSEAADLFYQFLYDDPAEETLQDAAAVLRDAPSTTKTNKLFSSAIEDFLAQ